MVPRSAGTPCGDLRFARSPSDGKVEIQDFSSGQAASFQVVPSAKHFGGDAEILGYRLYRIAFAHLVAHGRVGVGAGIRLFAGGDGDDQTALGRERFIVGRPIRSPVRTPIRTPIRSCVQARFRTSIRTHARTRLRTIAQVIAFGYGGWRGGLGAGIWGQGFSALHLVITPGDALVDWNGGDRDLKPGGGSGGYVELEISFFAGKFRGGL